MTESEKVYYNEIMELKERVSLLEKSRLVSDGVELIFSTSDNESARSFSKKFEFVSNKEQSLNFNISGKIASNSMRAQIIVYLDGIKIRSVYTNSGDFSFVCKSLVDKSFHTLEVNIIFYLNFTLENLTVKFVGAVGYKERDTNLQVANFNDFSVVCFRCDDVVTLYKYDGVELIKKVEFSAKYSGVSKLFDDFAVGYIDDEKNFRVKVFNSEFNMLAEFFVDSAVNKISGGVGSFGAKFFAVKNSRAFCYDFDENLNVVKTSLNYMVKDIIAFPNVDNAVIFTDYSENSRLIV